MSDIIYYLCFYRYLIPIATYNVYQAEENNLNVTKYTDFAMPNLKRPNLKHPNSKPSRA